MEGYELLHVIGSGSFGKVFMGRNKTTGETVALKKISKGGRQEREIKSLRQECEIQKNLHHPNIIQMLDSFETDDSVVVVTEYAQGDLCKLMIREGRLKLSKVQLIACHLVSALYFLHSHRILHRDIKPQNILIGWDSRAKLCDFGFARTMGINTYMLTSIKGTPLYMAPEIVQEKPYDHNADLWSLGCILYELLVGTPPFFTTSLFQLVRKIKTEEIVWPENITEDSMSFLKGLLEKDPQKRLTWPALLSHPFVRDGLHIDKTVEEFSLTKALSPSQELAKEKQRQNLQRKLAGYSKLLVKTAKKLEEAQKELKRCSEDSRTGIKTPVPSPNVTKAPSTAHPLKSPRNCANIGVPPQDPLKISPNLHSALPDTKNLKVMFQNMNVNERANQKLTDAKSKDDDDPEGNSGASSCETMTSSSDFDTDDSDEGDDDTNTVIMEGSKKRYAKKNSSSKSASGDDQMNKLGFLDRPDKPSSRGGSGLLWKSGALFTLHSFGSEDKPINSDEWIYFLINTMKEVLDNPKSLCEKHFLTMLVAPLRNHLAEPEVVEKIAVLLALPFTLDKSIHEQEPGLMSNLQTLYLDTKVLPNLLYSCKLIVRRRRVERGSVTLEEIPSILTVEDLEGLEKCLRLITFLVHMDEDFVTQLCDSVCVLQAFAILQLFIKLDGIRSGLAADMISILCHILRTFPSNKSIVEEVLLDANDGDEHAELWRLITHSNSTIQSRSLRVFVYLCRHSERVKTEFLGKHRSKVWGILRRATISSQADVRETAEFVLQALNYKASSIATAKSNSTASNSGCRSQMVSAPPLLSTSTSRERLSNDEIGHGSSREDNCEVTSTSSEVFKLEELRESPVTHSSGQLDDASR